MKNEEKKLVVDKIEAIFEEESIGNKEARRILSALWRIKNNKIKAEEETSSSALS